MSNNTQLAIIPSGVHLPAFLQTPDIAAQVAASNAAAAGGIKVGGFPKISIKGSKFHEVDGGETRTMMMPAAPGQPPLPMMCLEVVIVAANPAIVKTYYEGKWSEGDADAPNCQSSNGITPDTHVVEKQAASCAACPKNAWGSKISEASGKEVKACSDSKQLVVLPVCDLNYKALGFAVTPAALGEWGKFVKALSDRSIPVGAIVTNLTFDHTASFPKVQFAFNRFLTPDEFAKVQQRALGDDVQTIIKPAQTPPALPAPVAAPALAAPAPDAASLALRAALDAMATATATPIAAPAVVPVATGFGAVAPVAAPAPEEAAAKRTRKPRTPAAAPAAGAIDLSHLPPAILEAVKAVGADSPAGQVLLAQFPAPAPVAPPPQPAADPFDGQPPHVKPAVMAAAPANRAMVYKALTGMDMPADSPYVTAVTPPPVAAPAAPVAAPAPAVNLAPAVATAASAAVVSSATNLKELLQKKLGIVPAVG